MTAIAVKTEYPESDEDVKPVVRNEGGGGGGGNDAASPTATAATPAAASAVVGVKTIVEKQQAALKVAMEAKQMNLRLREQKQMQQQPPQPQPQPQPQQPQQTSNAIAMGKRRTSAQNWEETIDQTKSPIVPIGIKRFRPIAPKPTPPTAAASPTAATPRAAVPHHVSASPYFKPNTKTAVNKGHLAAAARPPPASSSRCGEIFVTQNAKKWTFVCTFCQKTTRDIGEFVCHIKFKHMDGQYDDNDGDINDDMESQMDPEMDDPYNNHHEQDYFDCASYLDVNVHTDADEPSAYNGGKGGRQQPAKAMATATATMITSNAVGGVKTPQSNNYGMVNLVGDEDDNDDHNNDDDDNTIFNTEVFDYDMDDDEEGVEIVDDDNDNTMEGMEGDEDHLAFLRSDSMDEKSGIIGGVRKYRSHVRGKAYCNICDKTFQYYSLYRNHMIKHSNVTPYKCQYCSKAFKSKQAIRYHMNTHTKEVQYKCELCPVTYGTENQFITHVLNHESDTCFPCMVCAKLLNSDQEREEHLETHTEERPYGCEYCNKRFRQRHHLSNHLKLHCQYRCDFCKEEFASTQTQRRPYACATCESYPDIRQQVEKQRSKALNNNAEANPLAYENAAAAAGGVGGNEDDPECVDLAEISDDDESETSTLVGPNGQKRVPCKFCTRTYKHISALNYHMRMKHQGEWKLSK